jgi:hypothetical protein
MASNIPALRAKVQQERDLVATMVADIDLPAEQALMNSAQATYDALPAHETFRKASNRWAVVNEKINRLAELDRQIALFGP